MLIEYIFNELTLFCANSVYEIIANILFSGCNLSVLYAGFK